MQNNQMSMVATATKKLPLIGLGVMLMVCSLNSQARPGGDYQTNKKQANHTTQQCKHAARAGHHRQPGKRMERLLNMVDATPEQRAAIKAERQAFKPQIKQIKEHMRAAYKGLHTLQPNDENYAFESAAAAQTIGDLTRQRVLLKAQLRQRVQQHLTPAQQEKLHAAKQKFRAKHKPRGERHGKAAGYKCDQKCDHNSAEACANESGYDSGRDSGQEWQKIRHN